MNKTSRRRKRNSPSDVLPWNYVCSKRLQYKSQWNKCRWYSNRIRFRIESCVHVEWCGNQDGRILDRSRLRFSWHCCHNKIARYSCSFESDVQPENLFFRWQSYRQLEIPRKQVLPLDTECHHVQRTVLEIGWHMVAPNWSRRQREDWGPNS